MQNIIKQLEGKGVLTDEIKNNLLKAKSMEELLELVSEIYYLICFFFNSLNYLIIITV